ncbi:hypothetical protein QJ857_gp0749 [Tupanvirus soda lake]|uniref:Uncharacterized protein n=2 Tax=Tupanvirus TaxID=2094720 RepID=A0A6N1NL33_9VIRU|nr:hypothetical protein QJ857_gp0749 [Tupanvirus soda lake]QKU35299.1 hypothetical protein [Tupanvirus soda lake]
MSLVLIHKIFDNFLKQKKQSYLQPLSVEYTADIHNGFVLCKLRQTYQITITDISEATYEFPVDYNSAFCSLVIKTPREEINGFVREKTEAKQIYNEAKTQGKQAFLTEETESDRDIYKLSMCNIVKDDTIIIEYTYITELEYIDKCNVFYIPSFISPRYNGNYIPNPKHSIKTSVRINNDPCNLRCSMPNTFISVKNGSLVLDYISSEVINSDIEIKFSTDYKPKAYKFESNGYKMAMMQFIPTADNPQKSIIKDVVFVLDCSGSMLGDRIKNSKKAIVHCLESLRNKNNYRFNIICYGSSHSIYSKIMLYTNENNINNAVAFVQTIEATMGGTETQSALEACLRISKTAILITDGDTSNNQSMHDLCKQFDCLSILGIGSGINRANIKDMAKNGCGIALFSQTDIDIINNIEMIFKSVTNNSIKNYAINWNNGNNSVSSTKPIIYENLNTLFSIIYSDTDIDKFTMTEANIEMQFESSDLPIDSKYIGALAAKRIIQENEIGQFFTKEKLIDLAIKFNIITQYTSMVAVSSLKPNDPYILENPVNLCRENFDQASVCGARGPMGPQGPCGMPGLNNTLSFKSMLYSDCSPDHQLYHNLTTDPNDVSTYSMKHTRNINSPAQYSTNRCIQDTSKTTFGRPTESGFTSTSKNKKRNSTIDRNTDYLFDYFMHEDKFDIQLCKEYNQTLENNKNNAESIEWEKEFDNAFTNSKGEINDKLVDYFDYDLGLFSPKIKNIIPDIPAIIINDEHILTLFILYCLRREGMVKTYNACYNISIKNKKMVPLFEKMNFVSMPVSN